MEAELVGLLDKRQTQGFLGAIVPSHVPTTGAKLQYAADRTGGRSTVGTKPFEPVTKDKKRRLPFPMVDPSTGRVVILCTHGGKDWSASDQSVAAGEVKVLDNAEFDHALKVYSFAHDRWAGAGPFQLEGPFAPLTRYLGVVRIDEEIPSGAAAVESSEAEARKRMPHKKKGKMDFGKDLAKLMAGPMPMMRTLAKSSMYDMNAAPKNGGENERFLRGYILW